MKDFWRKLAISAYVTVTVIAGTFLALHSLHNRKPYAPVRPSGIAADATYIQGSDGKGTWDECHFQGQEIFCSIRSVSGVVFEDEAFVAYSGSSPKSLDGIQITQASGDSWISLANGIYLIPETNNEGARRYLDFMSGKTKRF